MSLEFPHVLLLLPAAFVRRHASGNTYVGLLLLVAAITGCAPPGPSRSVTSSDQSVELERLYGQLPYQDLFPIPDGPVLLEGEVRPIRIGFSQTGFNHPWRVEMVNSALAQASRHPNIEIVVTDGKVDVVKQSGDIADLLARGVDALILSPVEDAGLRAATRRAFGRVGIPVIVLDRDVATDKTIFIGQSNRSMAARVSQVLVERLTERFGEPRGALLVITGLQGSTPAIERHEGFLSVIRQHPKIEILATGDGEWIREPAVRLAEDWLVRFPQINAIFSHAEESSWGAQLAIERAGRADEAILHFTHDGSNYGFCSVKAGLFEADGNYTPYIGQLGVRAALYALQGRQLAGAERYAHGLQLELPDLPVVTRENVDDWVGKGWGDWDPDNCERYAVP